MSASKLSLKDHQCLYEVLNVARSASEAEIAKAYKKQALLHHPDRNIGNEEEATERFKQIQAAFEILSDKNERAFYDAHREQILRGVDPTADGSPSEEFDLMPLFTPWAFSSFDDSTIDTTSTDTTKPHFKDPRNFYAVYAAAFERIRELEGRSLKKTPRFGNSQSSSASVHRFYAFWAEDFHSTRNFGYATRYNLAEAENRWMRKEMSKLNSKAKQQEKRKWEDTVMRLALFVRRRDPRWRVCMINADKREKEARQQRRREQAKHRRKVDEQKKAEIMQRIEQQSGSDLDWELIDKQQQSGDYDITSRVGVVDSVDADHQADPFTDHPYECMVCEKIFKSAATLATHERGQKHLKQLEKLREQLELEEAILFAGDMIDTTTVVTDSVSASGTSGEMSSSKDGGTGDIADGEMDIETVEALKEWLKGRQLSSQSDTPNIAVDVSSKIESSTGKVSDSTAKLSPAEEQIHLDELLAMQMQELEEGGIDNDESEESYYETSGDGGGYSAAAMAAGGPSEDTLESAATQGQSEGNSQVELDRIFAQHLASGLLPSEEEGSTLTAAEKLEMLEEHELLTAIEVSQLAADILALEQQQHQDSEDVSEEDEDGTGKGDISAVIDIESTMKKNRRAKSKRLKKKKRRGKVGLMMDDTDELEEDGSVIDQVKVAAMIDVALDERSLDKLLDTGICKITDLLNKQTGELDPVKVKRYQRKLARMKKRDHRKTTKPGQSSSAVKISDTFKGDSATAADDADPDEEAAIVKELETELRLKKENEEISALHDSQRIQQFLDRFIVGGGSISTDSPTTPDTLPASSPVKSSKPKPKRRKQRKKDQRKAQHKQEQAQRVFKCAACFEVFASNSKLHKHLKDVPKHALLVNRGKFVVHPPKPVDESAHHAPAESAVSVSSDL